ncbi:FabD/lysophospholipase-like protein, partial [Thozetella sp. PMI_491]
DGGGIRGLSSLLILESVMEKVRDTESLGQIPRPCDYFDLIGGTSTGGIIAIMLGRLRMTVDECIRAYKEVAQQAFTPKRTAILPARPTGAFSAKALEAAIKRTIKEHCINPGCVSRRNAGQNTTETLIFHSVVLAITKANVDAPPTLFKTYDTATSLAGCKIWEVARATSAATTFFKSIKVGRDEIEFVDAGFGYNNPCEILIEEAERQFPNSSQLRILSIGTGLGDVVTIANSRRSIINALKKMASSSNQVAARLGNKYRNDNRYCRLNVDQGLHDVTLSDWDKASSIISHTAAYISK